MPFLKKTAFGLHTSHQIVFLYDPYPEIVVKTTALGPFLGKGVYVVDVLTWTCTPVFLFGFFSCLVLIVSI
ncbi:MAG: hypothetical protein JRD87_13455 [Deltaproteobacteria bacterium]|jgi:hypothetical protein|nr:hypothetical protein [Deltaproteobacteria bacterium]MBW2670860.1 hypothetical protein [Deltaproteobacteria bacterium]NOQ18853.1 hypothetical protein [Desulfobacterales bacterium]